MNILQLGQLVKRTYNAYQDVSDSELGQRVVEKYPQYRQRLTDNVQFAGEQFGQALQRFGQQQVDEADFRPKISDILRPTNYANRLMGAGAQTLVGGQIASYGRTLENVSTPQGRDLLKQASQQLVSEKPSLDTLSNPALEAGLDATDLLPGGLLFAGGVKALKSTQKAGKAVKAADKTADALKPLLKEARKYKSAEEMLPKELVGKQINEIKVFGSSIKGGKYNDIDVAVFVPRSQSIDGYNVSRVKKGSIEYHIFPDTESGRKNFIALSADYDGSKPTIKSFTDIYNQSTKSSK